MKILILSESIAGSGHTKAAENLAKGIRMIFPPAEIKVDTSLSQVSPFLEKWTSRLYMGTIRHVSPLWGWAYERDQEWSFLGKNGLKKFVSRRLVPYIQKESPQLVISTHAFCLGGLAELKRKYGFSFRLAAALTDFCVNPFWIFDEVDDYFVAAEPIKQQLMERFSLPAEKIHVTGIPLDPSFTLEVDHRLIRRQFGIAETLKLVLVSGGGLGLVPYGEILQALHEVDHDLYVVILAGRNQHVREEVEMLLRKTSFRHPVLILDYVTNMHEWMKTADLMIGKPGGLTVSETFACRLPLLVYKPIPGQEERNCQFLLKHGVAFRAENTAQLTCLAHRLCTENDLKESLKQKLGALAKPASALEAGNILLSAVCASDFQNLHNYK